jgi:uroporphyrinogen decarboxylase
LDGGNLSQNSLFMRALRREPVPRVPVWLMRQAGRCDPAYRAYRERVGLSLHQLFRDAEHATALSLLPRRFGVDAIILYQDILTPLEPMGADFDFSPGPALAAPVRSEDGVRALGAFDPGAALPFIRQEIATIRRALGGELPLLGFAGAPFTLAAFLIEGESPAAMPRTLAFAAEQPRAFQELMARLTRMTVDYLNYQAECGADAVQLFESVGDVIPAPLYERYAQPSHEQIMAGLRPGLPAILFVKGSPFPEAMARTGAAAVSVSHTADLRRILASAPVAVQGNVDNRTLAQGTAEEVAAAVRACIAQGGGRGHILNLNHGVLPETPFENVLAFIAAARSVTFPPPAAGQPEAD